MIASETWYKLVMMSQCKTAAALLLVIACDCKAMFADALKASKSCESTATSSFIPLAWANSDTTW